MQAIMVVLRLQSQDLQQDVHQRCEAPLLPACRLGPFNPFSGGAPVASVASLPSPANAWDMLLPPTMYVDSKGVVFLGLDAEEHHRWVMQ